MKAQKCLLRSSPRVRSQWLSTPRVTQEYLHRRHNSSSPRLCFHPLEVLKDANITIFRDKYFSPERPIVLSRQSFRDLPAFDRWFQPSTSNPAISHLNTAYLEQHGADAVVPLELTQTEQEQAQSQTNLNRQLSFRKFHAPLSFFLGWIRAAESQSQSARLYLAQCQLLDLPQVLRDDFPTPLVVAQAGRGDVYDTNVWIGYPPTYTPLHRDPNPNLFVQLAGRKVVRLLAPTEGQAVFSVVRRRLGRSGGREAAAIRGEEMMQGEERALLEQAVWNDVALAGGQGEVEGYEAELEAGDGVFIPRGWWHSIKGVGEGVTASVNWWFR